jgi:hypothetical protein
VVPSRFIKRVEVVDPDVTSSDEPVIGNHRSGDTTEQDTVSAEVVGEGGGRGVEEPGVHTDTDEGGNVTTSSDVDVSGEKGGQVTSSRDRVGSDVEEQLNIDEATANLTSQHALERGREREGARRKDMEKRLTKASPARVLGDGSTSSIRSIICTTSQICSPNCGADAEAMPIPRKEVMIKPIGRAMICGQTAAPGVLAREAKSGALVTISSALNACKVE